MVHCKVNNSVDVKLSIAKIMAITIDDKSYENTL